jgi:hypothetical protein
MTLLPFVALLCGIGADWLWRQRPAARAVTIIMLIVALLQFGVFYRDYFTHYKFRSAFYYDPVAFRDVAAELLRHQDVPRYFFSTELDDAPTKWRFFATKANRVDVLSHTQYVSRDDFPLDTAPAGSLCVTYVDKATTDALTASHGWTLARIIHDVDNREAAAIYRRTP